MHSSEQRRLDLDSEGGVELTETLGQRAADLIAEELRKRFLVEPGGRRSSSFNSTT